MSDATGKVTECALGYWDNIEAKAMNTPPGSVSALIGRLHTNVECPYCEKQFGVDAVGEAADALERLERDVQEMDKGQKLRAATIRRLDQDLAASEARAEAMRPYLQHATNCKDSIGYLKDDCTCGLSELIGDTPP